MALKIGDKVVAVSNIPVGLFANLKPGVEGTVVGLHDWFDRYKVKFKEHHEEVWGLKEGAHIVRK